MSEIDTEIDALDDVILRFIGTDDAKLEAPVKRVLPRLLRRLGQTAHPQLRAKILDVFSHLNKRFKLLPNFNYPLPELLNVFAELGATSATAPAVATAFASNFCLIYLEKAFKALPSPASRLALLPLLLLNITRRPGSVRLAVLKLFLETLADAGSNASHFGTGTDLSYWEEERIVLETLLTRLRRQKAVQEGDTMGTSSTTKTSEPEKTLLEEAQILGRERGLILRSFSTDILADLGPSPVILPLARRALYTSSKDLAYILDVFADVLLYNPHAALAVSAASAQGSSGGSALSQVLSNQINPLMGPTEEQALHQQAAREQQERQKYVLATAGISPAGVARLSKVLPATSQTSAAGGAQTGSSSESAASTSSISASPPNPASPTSSAGSLSLPNITPQRLEQLKLAIVEFLFAASSRIPVDLDATDREREQERLRRQAEADAEQEAELASPNATLVSKPPPTAEAPNSMTSTSLLKELCALDASPLQALGLETSSAMTTTAATTTATTSGEQKEPPMDNVFRKEASPILTAGPAVFLLHIAAASLGADRAVHRAEDALKRLDRYAVTENPDQVRRLFNLGLGLEVQDPAFVDVAQPATPSVDAGTADTQAVQYRTRTPISDQLKIKVLGLLSSSVLAVSLDAKLALRLIVECLFPRSSSPSDATSRPAVTVLSLRLQAEAVRFSAWLLSRAPPALASGYGGALLPVLKKVLTSIGAARDRLRSARAEEAAAARSLAGLGPGGGAFFAEAANRASTSVAVLEARSCSLRASVLNALGTLANAAPKRVNGSLDLFELILKPLLNDGADEIASGERDEDVKNLLQSAQAALALLRPAFSAESGCSEEVRATLKKRLIQLGTGFLPVSQASSSVTSDDATADYISVPKRVQHLSLQYINDLWSFSDCEARIVCLVQLANPNPEIRSEARRGLVPRSTQPTSSVLSGRSSRSSESKSSATEAVDGSATSGVDSSEAVGDDDTGAFTTVTMGLSASQALQGTPSQYPSFVAFMETLARYVRMTPSSTMADSESSMENRGWLPAVRSLAEQAQLVTSPLNLDPRTLERTVEFAQDCFCASALIHASNVSSETESDTTDAAASPTSPASPDASAGALVAKALKTTKEAVDVTTAERLYAAHVATSGALRDYTYLIESSLNATSVFHGGADGASRPQEVATAALLRLIQAAPDVFTHLVIPTVQSTFEEAKAQTKTLAEAGRRHEKETGDSFFKRMLGLLYSANTTQMRYASATILSHMTPAATPQQLAREILTLLPAVDNARMPARLRAAISLITRLQALSQSDTGASAAWATALSAPLSRFYDAASKRGPAAAAATATSSSSAPTAASQRQTAAQLPGSLLALGCMLSELIAKTRSESNTDTQHVVKNLTYFCLHLLAWWLTPGSKSVTEHPEATSAAFLALARVAEADALPLPMDTSSLDGTGEAATASQSQAVKPWQGGSDGEPLTKRSLLALIVLDIVGTYQRENGPDAHAGRRPGASPQAANEATTLTPRQAARVGDTGALALGMLAVGDRSSELLDQIRLALVALGAVRHEEVQFALGQAVCLVAAGRDLFLGTERKQATAHDSAPTTGGLAVYLRELYGFKPFAASETPSSSTTVDELQKTVYLVLDKLENGSLAARSSACIWMLCLCSQLGGKPSFSSLVTLTQQKLTQSLTESDQFVQECAAKALGALHDAIADPAQKKALVDLLLQTFTTGQTKVTADTVVEGSVRAGRARGGASSNNGATGDFSTYRDLLSVASEMGQPSLVYRFMDLAAHHSVWNSKVGAAFSLGHILKRAAGAGAGSDNALSPAVLSLVPRLYRYRFDPNEKVRASMTALWKLLVPDSSAAIAAQFEAITRDIVPALSQKSFRNRYSACLAMADLLSTHNIPAAKFPPLVEELWPLTFRVLDDVNSEGRKAGHTLAKALHALVVRLANPRLNTSTSAASGVVAATLPHVLGAGIASKVREVRAVSLRALLAVCEVASPAALRPHLPATITALAEGLSSLEPSTLAYLQFHAASFDMTSEQLEAARVQLSAHSPLASALETCLALVDGDSAAAVCKSLEDLIRQGVGLQTLSAAAKAIVTLISGPNAHRHRAQLVDRMASLAKTLCAALADASTSPTLRKAYAVALAHTCKIAKRKRIMKVIDAVTSMFGVTKPPSEQDDETSSISTITPLPQIVSTHPGLARLSSALAVREISRVAPVAARAYAKDLAPLAFMGMHLSRKTLPSPVPDAVRALPLLLGRGSLSTSTLLGAGPMPSGGAVGSEAPSRVAPPSPTAEMSDGDRASQMRHTLMERISQAASAAGIDGMGEESIRQAASAAGVNMDALISAVTSAASLAGVRAGVASGTAQGGSGREIGAGGSALDDAEDAIAAVTGDAQKPEPEDTEAAELFAEVWTELCSGNTMGALLFASDIISLCGAALRTTDVPYSIKAVALRTIESLCLVLYRSARPFRNALWEVLGGVLDETRIWQGKERLFPALAAFTCSALDDSNEDDASTILRPLLTRCLAETRRAKTSYRNRAIAAAGQLLGLLPKNAAALKVGDNSAFQELSSSIREAHKQTIGAIELKEPATFGRLNEVEDTKQAEDDSKRVKSPSSDTRSGSEKVTAESSTGLEGTKRQSLKSDSLQYELAAVAVTNALPVLAAGALSGQDPRTLASNFTWAMAVFAFGLRGGFGWNARLAAIEGLSYLFQQLAALAPKSNIDQFIDPVLVTAVLEDALLPELNEPRFAQVRLGVLDALANGLQLSVIASSMSASSHALTAWFPLSSVYRRVQSTATSDTNGDVSRAATKLISMLKHTAPKLLRTSEPSHTSASTTGAQGDM